LATPLHGVTLVMFGTWRWVIDAWLTPDFGASPFWKRAILGHRLFRKCRFWGIALSESAVFGASKSPRDSKRAVVAGVSNLIIPYTGTGFPRFCPDRRPLKTKKNLQILPMKCPYCPLPITESRLKAAKTAPLERQITRLI
jgi:hypothetical protein